MQNYGIKGQNMSYTVDNPIFFLYKQRFKELQFIFELLCTSITYLILILLLRQHRTFENITLS